MKPNIILEDTRNQPGKHDLKGAYFKSQGIEVCRTKLYVGDYTLPTDQSVCVDTKRDIQELVGDICGKTHDRFRNELIRAQEAGIKLIILVENDACYLNRECTIKNDVVRSINDLFRWKNPRLFVMKNGGIVGYYKNGRPRYRKVQKYPRATRGAMLAKAVITMSEKYGAEFIFCLPQESGEYIMRLLGGEIK